MDAFDWELMRRSPLAACVLESFDHVFDDAMLAGVWDAHRGRCYEDVLTFGDVTRLMRDALLRHDGSGHKLFLDLADRGTAPADESSFYRKLANTPVAAGRALLSEGTARLAALLPAGGGAGPAGDPLPACFDAYAVLVGDGKKIKDAAKRLAPARGFGGSLIGAKALVALDLRTGMAAAMSDSLDGLANDVPLVPALMAQLRALHPGRPLLTVWDRQFDDARTMRHLSARAGDAFVVRMSQRHAFAEESRAESADAGGRRVVDQVGVLGRGAAALRVRRVTLSRPGEPDVVVLTDLLDRRAFPAGALLGLYRLRWRIEQVFQQVTETFGLTHLIGSSPKAILFQFAFCLLLYNQMVLVRAGVAADGRVPAAAVSMHYLFADVRAELRAWAYHTDGRWPRAARRDAASVRRRLADLLAGSWNPVRYTKASDRKPRPKPGPKRRLHGGHSSVQRVIEGRAKVIDS